MRKLLTSIAILLLAGCSALPSDYHGPSSVDSSTKGTLVTPSTEKPAMIPGVGYGQYVSFCDHGNRVYVAYPTSGDHVQFSVVSDAPGCGTEGS